LHDSQFANIMGFVKGQDVLVMLKLLSRGGTDWSYLGLAQELGMSASEVHAAIKRAEEAGLYNPHSRRPRKDAVREFLVHGLRYVFPARPGAIVQGIPTAYAAPPLNQKLSFSEAEAPVMPLPRGPVRGPGIQPLYRSAPGAAAKDERLYRLLALVDAIRTGRARERKIARDELDHMLADD